METPFTTMHCGFQHCGIAHVTFNTLDVRAFESPQISAGPQQRLTRCPRATSSWARFAPMNPEAPVTKQFMLRP